MPTVDLDLTDAEYVELRFPDKRTAEMADVMASFDFRSGDCVRLESVETLGMVRTRLAAVGLTWTEKESALARGPVAAPGLDPYDPDDPLDIDAAYRKSVRRHAGKPRREVNVAIEEEDLVALLDAMENGTGKSGELWQTEFDIHDDMAVEFTLRGGGPGREPYPDLRLYKHTKHGIKDLCFNQAGLQVFGDFEFPAQGFVLKVARGEEPSLSPAP